MHRFTINPPVFFGASAIVLAFVLLGALAPDRAEAFFTQMQAWILNRFGWFYLLSVAAFLIAAVLFGFGRYGSLKLGPDESEPDFPFASWIAMLFAAGMGIGLMFFAVGEPMTHFINPPEAAPRSIEAGRQAMALTFFHWGIHAWAIYAIIGLSLAYFGYRYNLPLTIRSGLYPLLRDRIHGPMGHAVDVFAICGTVFGVATSLGFGVLQISAGLNHLTGVEMTPGMQIALIVAIIIVTAFSAVSGVHRGVRRLSELNLLLAVLLMLFVLAIGPTTLLMRSFVQNIGFYLDDIMLRTFNIYAYKPIDWINAWTLFYWAWWISWAPFVGMFIARISRGRTVRQFIWAVLFIPAGFTFLWMTVFGNSAMFVDTTIAGGELGKAIAADMTVGLFRFFEYLPFSAVSSTIVVMLVTVFFVTSADSGSLVVDTLAAGGNTETPAIQRLYWCVLIGAAASVLMLAGGLKALQTVTVASALPFTVVMLLLVWGLIRGMNADLAFREGRRAIGPAARAAAAPPWQRRLALMLNSPTRADVRGFIANDVNLALTAVADELTAKGQIAGVSADFENSAVSLTVEADGVRNFVYGVRMTNRRLPTFSTLGMEEQDVQYEARTHFNDVSGGYDIMGLTREQIIGDVLVQFDRYLTLMQSARSELYLKAPEVS